jgi:phosphoglucomutase
MSLSTEELAEQWLQLDKDETTREEINQLLTQQNQAELELRLRTRIAFGTAGLRAKMEAGFSRMNSLTVIQASQGLAAYLLEHVPDTQKRGVVIGHDARHNSKRFAKLAAAAFVAKGIKVWWYETPTHTPLVPFGVNELGAAAGVMVTASHNPAQDNGYKVYWTNGCQIIPPHDKGIAESILKNLEPISWDKSVTESSLLVEGSLGLVEEAYYKAVRLAADPTHHLTRHPDLELNYAYTAMHGVGLHFMTKALEILGVVEYMTVVQEQAHPDPNFPSVKFPNPEEKGALELAIHSANRHGVSLILASDPDADRLAVAEKVNGEWYQFTGNQIGILLASHILSTYTKPCDKLAMLATTVSSRMLATMAAQEGFHYVETLTGFKWLGNIALDLDEQGYDTRFAFEEAIGYMIPGVVHDKDAVSAAAVFLAAVVHWKQATPSLTPYQKLQSLYQKYGYFVEANTYLVSPSPATTNKIFAQIRAQALGEPQPYPSYLAKRKILKWRDLTKPYESETKDHVPLLPTDKESQMITCEVEGDVRFTIRASGTEPKIKIYVEGKARNWEKAERSAKEVLREIIGEWLRPGEFGLSEAS